MLKLLVLICGMFLGTSAEKCAQKMFDGRPKEWRGGSGFNLESYGGYWTLDRCKKKCSQNPKCKEFRIKKNKGVGYSGCVLMKSGTTYSGQWTTSFEMYKLVECCAKKKFDGRPKEWRSGSGFNLASWNGYFTLDQCKQKCSDNPQCKDFRIKKNKAVSYNGCVLMKAGTTESGDWATSFETYELVPCCAEKLFDGRPKEWRSGSGFNLASFGGYLTLDECKNKCSATAECREFRIKKNKGVSYNGCVLMKEGTTRSGQMTSSFTMYKLKPCE